MPTRRAPTRCIYLNERGELAEGSRTTIFIERDGKLLTPPLVPDCCPACCGRELIAKGKAQEAVLTLADLQSADARLPRQLGARARSPRRASMSVR